MPPPREKTTFASDFRRFFVRGLAILLPSVLTLWIVWQAYLFLDRQVAEADQQQHPACGPVGHPPHLR